MSNITWRFLNKSLIPTELQFGYRVELQERHGTARDEAAILAEETSKEAQLIKLLSKKGVAEKRRYVRNVYDLQTDHLVKAVDVFTDAPSRS